jgi:hypothetical protein
MVGGRELAPPCPAPGVVVIGGAPLKYDLDWFPRGYLRYDLGRNYYLAVWSEFASEVSDFHLGYRYHHLMCLENPASRVGLGGMSGRRRYAVDFPVREFGEVMAPNLTSLRVARVPAGAAGPTRFSRNLLWAAREVRLRQIDGKRPIRQTCRPPWHPAFQTYSLP